jgi:hypothetical protein
MNATLTFAQFVFFLHKEAKDTKNTKLNRKVE